jgi:Zn-dependent protease
MQGSLRIGRIAGIDVYINISWILIVVFLTVSLASGYFPASSPGLGSSTYFLLSLIASLLLFVSVLLHELAHSFVAKARGLPVSNIVLFIFGGVSNIEREPQSASVEFQMAFVGPLVSLLIGGLCYLLFLALRGSRTPVAAILAYLAQTNILLGIFNLIPGFPLDGGRVLRSILWGTTHNLYRATQVATIVGQVVAYLLILYGILQFFFIGAFAGLLVIFTGWFLLNAAQTARSQSVIETTFRGVTVGEVMNKNVMTVPANISLQRLIDEYFLPQGLRSALVMQADQLAGLITLSDIRHVARGEWAQTPVGMVMIPVERLHTATQQQQLKDVLSLMNGRDVNQLPVVQDGRLVGVLSRDAILRSLEVRRSIGADQRQAT